MGSVLKLYSRATLKSWKWPGDEATLKGQPLLFKSSCTVLTLSCNSVHMSSSSGSWAKLIPSDIVG